MLATVEIYTDVLPSLSFCCKACAAAAGNLLDGALGKSWDLSLLARQEVSSNTSQEEGEVPRTLEVELLRDLVDCCVAGDLVTVLGLVKVICTEAAAGVLSSRPGGQCEVMARPGQDGFFQAGTARCR